MVNIFQKFMRVLALFRLRPFDTATEGGRSKERFRRSALTTVSSGGARAIGMMVSLVTVPLTFSYLGTERYGLWMVLISIVMSVMGFADLGIGNGLINAISEAYGKDDHRLAREYFTSAFFLMLCIALFFALVAAVGYPFMPWMRLFNVKSAAVAAEGARALVVLYACFVVGIPLGVIMRAQAGLQMGYIPQIIGIFGSVFTLLALLLVIALHGSLAWLVFGSNIGGILATLVNGWFLFRARPWLFPAREAYRTSSAFKILNLGLLFFVLQCAGTLSYTSDNIVITQIMGAAAVAAYAVPQKLFSIVSMVVTMAIAPLWPAYGEALARGDVRWVRRVFWGSLWLTISISVPLCTLLAFAGPWILKVFFGKSLHVSMSVLVVLALWGIVGSVGSPTATLLNGAGVMKVQTIVAVFASLINIGLSIYFTRRFGVLGVCLGSIIAQLFVMYPTCFILIHRLFIRLEKTRVESQMERMPQSA